MQKEWSSQHFHDGDLENGRDFTGSTTEPEEFTPATKERGGSRWCTGKIREFTESFCYLKVSSSRASRAAEIDVFRIGSSAGKSDLCVQPKLMASFVMMHLGSGFQTIGPGSLHAGGSCDGHGWVCFSRQRLERTSQIIGSEHVRLSVFSRVVSL